MMVWRIVILGLLALQGCGDGGGPATGTERGPCYPNNTCNAGLSCYSGLCVRLQDGGLDGSARDGLSGERRPWDLRPGEPIVPGQVTTLAGSGVPGSKNGVGVAAEFRNPTGVAVSPAGDVVYVADRDNHAIRAVTIATGVVVTLAGSGTQGYLDGAGTVAELSAPTGLAVDSKGAILVADAGNHRIRKIVDGQVSTFAGSGVPGTKDDTLLAASFNSPRGVTTDPWGVVYVTDFFGGALRKITTSVGSAGSNQLVSPVGLASDAQGAVYIAVQSQHRIAWYTTVITTLAGSTVMGNTDGDALFAKFNGPAGVAVATGAVFVADTGNHRIRKIAGGNVSTLCGSTAGYRDGKLAEALLNSPYGLAVDGSGRLYVADTNNHRVRVIVP